MAMGRPSCPSPPPTLETGMVVRSKERLVRPPTGRPLASTDPPMLTRAEGETDGFLLGNSSSRLPDGSLPACMRVVGDFFSTACG